MTLRVTDLSGRRAVVTGGSSGIGLAAARALRAAGAQVVIVGRDSARLSDAVRELGADVVPVVADLSSESGAERMRDAIAGQGHAVDILFANAGASNATQPVWDTSEAEFDAVIGANLKSSFFTVTKLNPLLADGASIVLCSSVGYHRGTIGDTLYAAAKAGVRTLCRGFAADRSILERRIRVNTISFGAVRTPMTGADRPEYAEALQSWAEENVPLKRWAQPREAADAVLFLASEASSYITGIELPVDGGLVQL